jgi:hypothetical protein
MASGDITNVQCLGRFLLPGGGNTRTGKQVQNKIVTWGKITCTYVSTGINPDSATGSLGQGATFTKTVFGLETLDFVELTLYKTSGAVATKDIVRTFQLDTGSDLIFGLETIGVDAGGGSAAPTDGDTLDLRWLAVGDAHNADLT